MHYLVYKVVNKINGKFYIGVHKTTNKDDGYMGSGKLIKRALQKYGVENFEKTILFEATSVEEMFAKERELVVISEQSYNLKSGGDGGFAYINADPEIVAKRNVAAAAGRKLVANDADYVKKMSEIVKQRYLTDEKFRATLKQNRTIYQKRGTEAAREANKDAIFINNGEVSKKIKKWEPIPDGWTKGRLSRKI